MTADELARAAMALPGWSPMSGMVGTVHGQRCVVLGPDKRPADERYGDWLVMPCSGEWDLGVVWSECADYCRSIKTEEFVPDINDPATAACLLDLLGPGWSLNSNSYNKDPFRTYTAYCLCVGRGEGLTRGAACVAAAVDVGLWPSSTTEDLTRIAW